MNSDATTNRPRPTLVHDLVSLDAGPVKPSQGYTSRRIVLSSVVSERSLPFNLQAYQRPEQSNEVWNLLIASEPDHEPDKENVVVLCLNARYVPFVWHRVSLGDVTSSTAHPREILRPVIASAAYAFVLMHNHPAGDASPSRADEQVTRRIEKAAEIMQVSFLDHVIIGTAAPGRNPYYSFREAGVIS